MPSDILRTFSISSNLSVISREPLAIFSSDPLVYGFGASYSHYNNLVLLIIACSLLLSFKLYKSSRSTQGEQAWPLLVCLSFLIFYSLHLAIIGRSVLGYATALRYALPMMIAISPVAVLYACTDKMGTAASNSQSSPRSSRNLILGGVLAITLLYFFESLALRINQVVYAGSELSYRNTATKKSYLRYNRFVIDGPGADQVRNIQKLIPEGKTILASIGQAVHLDYARNPIQQVQAGGLGSRLQRFPFNGGLAEQKRYLEDKGIEYIFWQYRKPGMRSQKALNKAMRSGSSPAVSQNARRQNLFYESLTALKNHSNVLLDDGSYILYKLQ